MTTALEDLIRHHEATVQACRESNDRMANLALATRVERDLALEDVATLRADREELISTINALTAERDRLRGAVASACIAIRLWHPEPTEILEKLENVLSQGGADV